MISKAADPGETRGAVGRKPGDAARSAKLSAACGLARHGRRRGRGRVDQHHAFGKHRADGGSQQRKVGAAQHQSIGRVLTPEDRIQIAPRGGLDDRSVRPALLGQRDE